MNRDSIRQSVNIVAYVATLLVNFLSQAIPLNGQTSAEISNRIPIYFVPENYVFSIWGIIYLFLGGFIIYQALPSQRENPMFRRIGYWFALSSIGNSAWLFTFHYELFELSIVFMLMVLVSLIMIYIRTGNGSIRSTWQTTWFIHIPFSIYMAWITIATIANFSYTLFVNNWDGFGIGYDVWTVIMLGIAAAVVVILNLRHSDIAYTAVIVWALVGIIIKQSETAIVANAAIVVVAVVVISLLGSRLLRIQRDRSLSVSPFNQIRAGAGD